MAAASASCSATKPDNLSRLYGSVQNEALCMALARRCDLRTAEVTTGRAGERSYLLVTRYDRVEAGGRPRRLHQEDFCQALGQLPSAKYERNQLGMSGPSLADMEGGVEEVGAEEEEMPEETAAPGQRRLRPSA